MPTQIGRAIVQLLFNRDDVLSADTINSHKYALLRQGATVSSAVTVLIYEDSGSGDIPYSVDIVRIATADAGSIYWLELHLASESSASFTLFI